MAFNIKNTKYKEISSKIYDEKGVSDGIWLSKSFKFDNKDTRYSRNVVVMGESGCGKTQGFIKANIEEGVDSFVVIDKDNELRKSFQCRGQYESVDYIDPVLGEGKHNPFCYLDSKEDVESFTRTLHRLVVRSRFEVKDPVRDKLELNILTAYVKFIAYGYGYNPLICGDKIYPKSFRGLKDLVMSDCMGEYTKKARSVVGKLPSSFKVFDEPLVVCEDIEKEKRAAITNVSINLGNFLTNSILGMTDDCSFDMGKFWETKKESRVGLFINTSEGSKNQLATLIVWQIAEKLRSLKGDGGGKEVATTTTNFYLDNFGSIPKLPNATRLFEDSKDSNYNFVLCFNHFTEFEIRYGDKIGDVLSTCQFLLAYPFNPDTKTSEFVGEQVRKSNDNVDELMEYFMSDIAMGKVMVVSRKGPAFVDKALHSKDYVCEC